jgi:hypothetical protein
MRRELLYITTIAVGLFVSAEYAQWPVDIWCIGTFLYLYVTTDRKNESKCLQYSHLQHQWNYSSVKYG